MYKNRETIQQKKRRLEAEAKAEKLRLEKERKDEEKLKKQLNAKWKTQNWETAK